MKKVELADKERDNETERQREKVTQSQGERESIHGMKQSQPHVRWYARCCKARGK